MLGGTITGDEYFDYKLRANGGQKMFVELTVTDSNGSGAAFFNILPSGSSGRALYNSRIRVGPERYEIPDAVILESMKPLPATFNTSEGTMQFVFGGKTYYYLSDPGAAEMEVEHFQSQ